MNSVVFTSPDQIDGNSERIEEISTLETTIIFHAIKHKKSVGACSAFWNVGTF